MTIRFLFLKSKGGKNDEKIKKKRENYWLDKLLVVRCSRMTKGKLFTFFYFYFSGIRSVKSILLNYLLDYYFDKEEKNKKMRNWKKMN